MYAKVKTVAISRNELKHCVDETAGVCHKEMDAIGTRPESRHMRNGNPPTFKVGISKIKGVKLKDVASAIATCDMICPSISGKDKCRSNVVDLSHWQSQYPLVSCGRSTGTVASSAPRTNHLGSLMRTWRMDMRIFLPRKRRAPGSISWNPSGCQFTDVPWLTSKYSLLLDGLVINYSL